MHLAIVEDESIHSQLLASYIKTWSDSRQIPTSLAIFENAEQFLFQWEDTHYDAVFLDIQMNGMNGMELAHKIRSHDNNISLIFTTGIPDYIEEGYEVNALHYLRKPLNPDKVYACLDKVSSRTQTEHFLILQTTENEMVKIAQEHILYIEARGHETLIQPDQGSVIHSKLSISQLEKMLETREFIKCHRSYLCRISAIYRIDKDTIYFENGCQIPVSRRIYQTVNQAFIQYYRKL